jgi:hypothetical protein
VAEFFFNCHISGSYLGLTPKLPALRVWLNRHQPCASTTAAIANASQMRNPFYLDSKSGFDWTLNPVSTGQ